MDQRKSPRLRLVALLSFDSVNVMVFRIAGLRRAWPPLAKRRNGELEEWFS